MGRRRNCGAACYQDYGTDADTHKFLRTTGFMQVTRR